MGYIQLALAIIGEIIGTNLLKASAGFTKPLPTISSLVAYVACFYFLSLALKTVNLSAAYATWSGVGIILTTLIAVVFWHDKVSIPEIIGIVLIIVGVVVCNLFSNAH